MAEERKVVLITGCSYGLGTHIAKEFAVDQSYKVWAAVRAESEKKTMEDMAGDLLNVNLRIIVIDLTKPDVIQEAVETIIKTDGKIDILVNNAAHGLMGPFELLDFEKGREVWEVNFFGHARLMHLIIPSMKKARFGRVINISSLSSLGGVPFTDFYASSKTALEGLSAGLSQVLRPFDIRITIVQLGAVKTNNVMSLLQSDTDQFVYSFRADEITTNIMKKHLESLRNTYADDGAAQEPAEVAEKIKEISEKKEPSLREYTNEFCRKAASTRYTDVSGEDSAFIGQAKQ